MVLVSAVAERLFSEFLRQPNEIVAELEKHDVVLKRRDAPSVRLSQAQRDAERADAMLALTRVLRAVLAVAPDAVERAVNESFPWAHFLPARDRAEFIQQLTQTLAAAADIESFALFARLVHEWRATAAIHADPALAAKLRTAVTATAAAPVPKP